MFAQFKNKSVVVTGASKGIGKGIATVFASKGANVLVVSRNEGPAQRTADQIKKNGGTAHIFCGDVASWKDMQEMASAAAKLYGGIDVLCCNAGIFPSTKIESMAEGDWDQVLDVNLKGTFLAIKACLPHMKKKSGGRIILTSSITGPVTGYPGWSHYGASKAGMLGFIRTAAIELASSNITINAVLPGNIMTEGLENLGADYLDKMKKAVPLGRLGTVEDIANAMLFFASAEAGYITGQTLIVDGGQILPESLEALG
jgi:3-oxoacyl-[acyl-carrier protein] reductase